MSFLWIICGIVAVAGVSFGGGYFIGRSLSWKNLASTNHGENENPQMAEFIQRLTRMVGQLSQDVGRHQSKIEATSSELNGTRNQSSQNITEFVVGVVGKILESNEQLQQRLHTAESKLQEQGTQLDTYLTKSRTDTLTRLPNRRVFNERLKDCIEQNERSATPFALMMLDLDHFKAVNDGFGHLGGDYVLRELGATLSAMAGEKLHVARLGGEEFAVLAVGGTQEEIFRLAEKIRLDVANRYFSYDGVALSVTLSVGVSLFFDHETASDLLGRTDRALYAAKAAGRNRAFFNDGKRCVPIDIAMPKMDDSQEILGLCDELRHRMAEIGNE
jgi:diguanylate cyclase